LGIKLRRADADSQARMPTNKHFPDAYFADSDGPVHWGRALIWVALVAVVGLSATGRLDTVWSARGDFRQTWLR
jgi:hypothetical protein